jgi:hypothetical protein
MVFVFGFGAQLFSRGYASDASSPLLPIHNLHGKNTRPGSRGGTSESDRVFLQSVPWSRLKSDGF